MNFFRIFGALQIAAIVLYIIFGNVETGQIPFMLVGCVILFLVYFKLTGFLANQNVWKRMLQLVKKGKETVCDCELVNAYETSHGDAGNSKEYMADVRVGDKRLRFNTTKSVVGKMPGTRLVLVCNGANPESSFGFVFAPEDGQA